MRPVLAGHLHIADLSETRIGLLDIAILNDALDVQAENERRMTEATRR